jgi:hypothetical protein
MSGQSGGIGQNAMAANVAVMANVHAGHEQATGAEMRKAASTDGAAADGYAFPDGVVIADFRLRRLAAVLQILWCDADCTEGMKDVACADAGAAFENYMRD